MNASGFLGPLFLLFLSISLSVPVSARSNARPTVSYSVPSRSATTKVNGGLTLQQEKLAFVDSFFIHSDIRFRYSRTKVTSKVFNPRSDRSGQVKFNLTIPETAFISKFSMKIGNEAFVAEVAKREEETFILAALAPKSAAFVEQIDANLFTISANLGPATDAVFTLIYEELLERRLGLYEQVIHIDPDTVRAANDYKVTVSVADSRNLSLLRAIAGWDHKDHIQKDIPGAKVQLAGNIGHITWTPVPHKGAIPKKFILHYDIDHPEGAGQVLIHDGHFVHFFSPNKALPVQPKHIIFVLDISASMQGVRLGQLKAAMSVILKDLLANHKNDYFSFITFHSDVLVWSGSRSQPAQKRFSFRVTSRRISAALSFIDNLQASYSTNIHGALITALNVAAAGTTTPKQHKNIDPIIMLLTDGHPTEGVTNKEEIQTRILVANRVQQVPIFSLALGQDLDFTFLRTISQQNGGTARRVHDGSNTEIQMETIYDAISSPALSNVGFTYTSDSLQITDVTKTKFSRFFKDSEIIVAGKVAKEERSYPCNFDDCVHGNGVPLGTVTSRSNGTGKFNVAVAGDPVKVTKRLKSAEVDPCAFAGGASSSLSDDVEDLFDECGKDGFMERLWAFLRIKQLIEQAEADNSCLPYSSGLENPAQHALDLALKYGFVAPLTSLVVTRTDSTKEMIPFPYKGHTKLLSDLNRPHHQEQATGSPLRPNATQVPTTTKTAATTTETTTPIATAGPPALTLNDISWLSSDGNNWIQKNDKDEAYFVPRDAHDDGDEYEYDNVEEIPDDSVLCN